MAHAALDPGPLAGHPLDVVEQIVLAGGWTFDRLCDDEIAAEVSGEGSVYRLWFAWCPERETLHFTCAFDTKLPATRRPELYELLAIINERMWIGHFDLWSDQGLVTFRQALPLRGGTGLSPEQAKDLVEIALGECERFHPTFQYVIWGGASPREAMDAALFDTVGEA
ncbi:MAG: YbjN domain-containing protein [Alphaproteobacteria bacterium]